MNEPVPPPEIDDSYLEELFPPKLSLTDRNTAELLAEIANGGVCSQLVNDVVTRLKSAKAEPTVRITKVLHPELGEMDPGEYVGKPFAGTSPGPMSRSDSLLFYLGLGAEEWYETISFTSLTNEMMTEQGVIFDIGFVGQTMGVRVLPEVFIPAVEFRPHSATDDRLCADARFLHAPGTIDDTMVVTIDSETIVVGLYDEARRDFIVAKAVLEVINGAFLDEEGASDMLLAELIQVNDVVGAALNLEPGKDYECEHTIRLALEPHIRRPTRGRRTISHRREDNRLRPSATYDEYIVLRKFEDKAAVEVGLQRQYPNATHGQRRELVTLSFGQQLGELSVITTPELAHLPEKQILGYLAALL